ncbi:MAG: hypothetical protein RR478_00200 [Bacilli bacterium]
MNNKKLVWYIIFVAVVASFVTFGVTYYFMKDWKVENNPVEKNKEDDKIYPLKDEDKGKIKSFEIIPNIGDSYRTAINNKYYVLKHQIDDTGNFEIETISINDKVVLKTGYQHLTNVHLVGDLLVVLCSDGMSNGPSLKFIDMSGNLVKTINWFALNVIKIGLWRGINDTKDIIYKDNEIIFNCHTYMEIGPNVYLKTIGENNKEEFIEAELPLSKEIMKKYNVNDDSVAGGTFKIKYLGNNKFSEIEVVDKITYKDFLTEYQKANNYN